MENGAQHGERWRLSGDTIVWDIDNEERLPHEDHIEMSGRHVSIIVRYRVSEDRRLELTREIIWPTLRTKEGDVRGYLKRTYGPEIEPTLYVNGRREEFPPVDRIEIGPGQITIEYRQGGGLRFGTLAITRTLYPSADQPLVCEQWTVQNAHWDFMLLDPAIVLKPEFPAIQEDTSGVYGEYRIRSHYVGAESQELYCMWDMEEFTIGQRYFWFSNLISATAEGRPPLVIVENNRQVLLPKDAARLTAPEELLQGAFDFTKFRAAESLFETKMGLVHSPGGGRYYGGIWANDQVEYSGPFFAYLGDPDANRAALTAYRNFAPYMTPEYKPIPTSLEMEGTIAYQAGGDRGDAAMYASGAARYALANGDRTVAEELYPHIAWCLEYSRRKVNAAGVVESDCDELENRFPAGDANLCTACLYYDGLRRAADLARDLHREQDAADYDTRADALEDAIEAHFGATIHGFDTYRYYDGNTTLRAWICLPLAFGIRKRATGTLDALFSSHLWSPDGLATEEGKPDFWDRSTLYALRGAFFAGDTERAYNHLISYTRRRLLGEHVPYPVEAYPEGGQAHLSAESALYGRVLVEGMFGMVPRGLRRLDLTPRLPSAWPEMSLTLPAFGHHLTIRVVRETADALRVQVTTEDGSGYDQAMPDGATHTITLPE